MDVTIHDGNYECDGACDEAIGDVVAHVFYLYLCSQSEKNVTRQKYHFWFVMSNIKSMIRLNPGS